MIIIIRARQYNYFILFCVRVNTYLAYTFFRDNTVNDYCLSQCLSLCKMALIVSALGLCPFLYGYKGQLSIHVHSDTSLG